MNKKTINRMVLAILALLMVTVSAQAAITWSKGSTCGSEGDDFCITFTGWDMSYALASNSWATTQVLDRMQLAYGRPELVISQIHNNGFYGSAADLAWYDLIKNEVSIHRVAQDFNMHFSKYYISKPCQEKGGTYCRRGL